MTLGAIHWVLRTAHELEGAIDDDCICRVHECCALSGLLCDCVPVPWALPRATMSLPPWGEQRSSANTGG